MTQAELDRAIATKTGESRNTIAQRGFVLLRPLPVEREPKREPLMVDWDELERSRCSPAA